LRWRPAACSRSRRHCARPQRLPWLILTGKFLDDFEQMLDRWAAWATETVESWPEDLSTAQPDRRALREMDDNARALAQRAARRRAAEVDPT
jgi:hypothetical protein